MQNLRKGIWVSVVLVLTSLMLEFPRMAQAQDEPGSSVDEASLYIAPQCPAAKFTCKDPQVAADQSGRVYFTTSSCVYRAEGRGRYKPLAALETGYSPVGLAADNSGNVFISDFKLGQVRKVAPNGTITVVAGVGTRGNAVADGLAIHAQLSGPIGLAVDSAENLYIAEAGKSHILKVSANGTITTVAEKNGVNLVAVDGAGNLYIGETSHSEVSRIGPDGKLTRWAGIGGHSNYTGEGGPAVDARLAPRGLAADTEGNLYVADFNNVRLLRVSADGMISTVAGEAGRGFSGDGGPAHAAKLGQPTGVAVDGAGNIYIADLWDVVPTQRSFGCDSVVVRKVSAKDGTITTIVGGKGISLP